jgi:hypothetical protein
VARSINEQLEYARLAEQADPLDSDRAQFTVQVLMARALAEPPGLFPRSAEMAWQELSAWVERDANNFLTWQFAGDRALELAAQAERHRRSAAHLAPAELAETESADSQYVLGAAEYYRRAISRYATNCQLHAQLASVLALQGDWDDALAAADVAEQLSNETPHLDRKLAAVQVWLPLLSPALDSLKALPAGGGEHWYSAELVLSSIRNAKAARP